MKLTKEAQNILELVDELCELACLMDKMAHLNTTEKAYRQKRQEIIELLSYIV
jgi:hypothetical protein